MALAMTPSSACGGGKSKSATSPVPVRDPVEVVHAPTTCRVTQPPPKRPRAVHLVALRGGGELSLTEQEAFQRYADALEAYSYRVWRLCGEVVQ